MKYGETLRQRSIPEWSHYNVDYDVIKRLIKEHTTPGIGKAVSIPGQGNPVERAFEKDFYALLVEENERVDLFVKSKTGEITRRLTHLNKQIASVEPFDCPYPPGHKGPRRLERYAKIEREVLKTGQEINSLSRFVNAQKLAFRKLLKKYKKWTHSDDLVTQFTREICIQPDTYWTLEIETLFDEYTAVLHVIRAAFKNNDRSASPAAVLRSSKEAASGHYAGLSDAASEMRRAIERGDQVVFDTVFANAPFHATSGSRSYWVHPDSLVEIQVLLLHHMKLLGPSNAAKTPPLSSGAVSPVTTLRRQSSDVKTAGLQAGRDDDVGTILLDHPDRFTAEPSDNKPSPYAIESRLEGDARWLSTGDAIVTVSDAANSEDDHKCRTARVKRKYLQDFFDLESPFKPRSPSVASVSEPLDNLPESRDSDIATIEDVRKWLARNENARPIGGICARRSRFQGLSNSPSKEFWAVLDRDIVIKKSLLADAAENDWAAAARREASDFPYVVLQLRFEGPAVHPLITALDASHLTERIDGFSLEKHAIWQCCKSDDHNPPPWISKFGTDIRKLPAAAKRFVRRPSSQTVLQAHIQLPPTSQHTSTGSNTDYTRGASTPGKILSSNTSLFDASDASVPIKAKRSRRKPTGPSPFSRQNSTANADTSKYWNEYDHPEEGEENETYYIYIDPDAHVGFPGVATIKKLYERMTAAFQKRPEADEESALLAAGARSRPSTSGDDETSSDDDSIHEARRTYGTISHLDADSDDRSRLFPTIFPISRPALQPRSAQYQQTLILSERELIHRESKLTKLRLYVTSLVASVVILVTVIVLSMTGRRKLRGEVDAGILFGIIANLIFAFAGVGYMLSRRDRIGWIHRGLVYGVFATVCLADGMLLASLISW